MVTKMKLLIVVSIFLFLVCPCVAGFAAEDTATEVFPYTARITAYDVNVRAGSNLNYEMITRLDKGDLVLVADRRLDWFKVMLPEGILCWVYAELVDEDGFVKGNNVNIRSGAGGKYNVMCQLNRDDKVRVIKKSSDGKWLGIVPPENAGGWIHRKFLVKIGGPKVYKTYVVRRKKVTELLMEADRFRDQSLKHKYQDIDFEKIAEKYRFIENSYGEFKESKIAAKRTQQLIKTQDKLYQKERQRLETLKKLEQQRRAEWEQQKKRLKYKSFRGVLQTTSSAMKPSTTHKLVRDGNSVCLLRSDVINLDDYGYRHIKVWGHVLRQRIKGLPVVIVDKIKVVY